MTRILVAGFQHETNTFAPSPADWAAFNRGESFPAFVRGPAMFDTFRGVNAPVGGFMNFAQAQGWTLVPSAWAGATPSSYITRDAFERMTSAILDDVREAMAQEAPGLDAIYLDLHGAAVAEHVEDCEGELLERLRGLVGSALPIVASLDLHANVSRRMLDLADALVAYRTYPHVDMAVCGERAARLLAERLRTGQRAALHSRSLPFLIPLPSQSTWMQPAQRCYERLEALDAEHGTTSSFCMGFPAADIAEGAPVLWSYGATPAAARAAAEALYEAVAVPAPWALHMLDAPDAVARALDVAAHAGPDAGPVVIADTQDNCGVGANSNTTGMLHALLAQGAGRRHPGRVVVGLLYDEAAARVAHEVGVGGHFDGTVGTAVPTYSGQPSDPPLAGRFTVRSLADGRCELKGPMMTGLVVRLGLCACLEIDGVLIAVVSGKVQLLDREMLRMVGVEPEAMRLIVVKSSNHFRADFTPIAAEVLVAKAAGPLAADPADLPWRRLPPDLRGRISPVATGVA